MRTHYLVHGLQSPVDHQPHSVCHRCLSLSGGCGAHSLVQGLQPPRPPAPQRYYTYSYLPASPTRVLGGAPRRGYWAGEFGLLNVGSTVLGDSAAAFREHRSSWVSDPLAQHHQCRCTVDSASECDDGRRSQASRCYVARCPTGAQHDDGYRGCTCAWKQTTDHSPPHGCTAEVRKDAV